MFSVYGKFQLSKTESFPSKVRILDCQWADILSTFKDDIKYFKSFTTTFQAKAIISKSKLLSKLTYICSVHVMPIKFKNSINKLLLGFLTPFSTRFMNDKEIADKITGFSAPKYLGGYGVDQISIHAGLLLLKPVMKYVKCRVEETVLPNEVYFVEYHIGIHLSRMFGFRINNCTTHTDRPCEVYNHVLEMIRLYDITREELVEGSVNKIYKRIIVNLNQRVGKLKYYRMLSNVLPSYLQSFNYKLHNNLLPVSIMFREYALDNNSCCFFCCVGPESIFHVFGTCEKLEVLWKIASETVFLLTQKQFDFADIRRNLLLDLVCVNLGAFDDNYEKLLIYLNTVLNHSIWKERNEIKFNFKRFKIDNIVGKVIRSIRGRRNVDNKLLETRRIPFLRDLCSTFLAVAKRYFPIDNG